MSDDGPSSSASDPRIELRDQFDQPIRVGARVQVMALCEQEFLILRPDRLYFFAQRPGCARCATLAGNAPGSIAADPGDRSRE